MKRKLILLGLSLIASVAIVAILFFLSDRLRRQPGAFLRILPPHPAIQDKTMDLGYNSYYIAGLSNSTIYLGNYTAPLHLLTLNYSLTDSQHVKLNVKNIENEKFWSVRVKVDSPRFYVMDGTVPRIYSGNISNWQAERNVNDSAYFVDAVPISKTSFAIRSLSSANSEYELGKKMLYSAEVTLKPDLLEKQIDGQFCVDGMMDYDPYSGILTYVYFYRNEYIVTDSSLNLKFRGNTIDTVSTAKFEVSHIVSNNTSTISTPPLIVNRRGCVYDHFLFINSALIAKNEINEEFDRLSVIDVYDLNKRAYAFSFYLSHYSQKKLHDFQVRKRRLIALIDHDIVVYNLSSTYFSD